MLKHSFTNFLGGILHEKKYAPIGFDSINKLIFNPPPLKTHQQLQHPLAELILRSYCRQVCATP